jgi:hypothetical protein
MSPVPVKRTRDWVDVDFNKPAKLVKLPTRARMGHTLTVGDDDTIYIYNSSNHTISILSDTEAFSPKWRWMQLVNAQTWHNAHMRGSRLFLNRVGGSCQVLDANTGRELANLDMYRYEITKGRSKMIRRDCPALKLSGIKSVDDVCVDQYGNSIICDSKTASLAVLDTTLTMRFSHKLATEQLTHFSCVIYNDILYVAHGIRWDEDYEFKIFKLEYSGPQHQIVKFHSMPVDHIDNTTYTMLCKADLKMDPLNGRIWLVDPLHDVRYACYDPATNRLTACGVPTTARDDPEIWSIGLLRNCTRGPLGIVVRKSPHELAFY